MHRYSGTSIMLCCSPHRALTPRPPHIRAINAAPVNGTAPTTTDIGASAATNPTARYPMARPPWMKFIRPVNPANTAQEDTATSWLIRVNPTNGTHSSTTATTAIRARRNGFGATGAVAPAPAVAVLACRPGGAAAATSVDVPDFGSAAAVGSPVMRAVRSSNYCGRCWAPSGVAAYRNPADSTGSSSRPQRRGGQGPWTRTRQHLGARLRNDTAERRDAGIRDGGPGEITSLS